MGKKNIVDTFLDSIVLLDDETQIANTFKAFLKKAKTTDEKINLSTCYKKFIQQNATNSPVKTNSHKEEPIMSGSLEDALKKREEVTESIKLFNNGKNFNIDQFNNFFENLRVKEASNQPINYQNMSHLDFGDPFSMCQPIIEYGGIIVEDDLSQQVLDKKGMGVYELSNLAHQNIENFKNTKVSPSYSTRNNIISNETHKTPDEYIKSKKERIEMEMNMKKQRVLEKVKNGYYQGANSAQLERQLANYNHHEMVDKLAHGAFKK